MNTGKKIAVATPTDTDANVSPEERALLDSSIDSGISFDNNNLRRSALDNTDTDGDPVNETSSDLTGEDLDIPGVEPDDPAEDIGQEDEENNGYSQADTE